jgi:hypothetical protein
MESIMADFQHLPKKQARLLAQLVTPLQPDGFFLGGGAALAMRLGHRDCGLYEYFSPNHFDAMALSSRLLPLRFVTSFVHTNAVSGRIGDVNFSFSHWPIEAPITTDSEIGPISSSIGCALSVVAAMTLRGSRTDYVDLYAAMNEFKLKALIEETSRVFGLTAQHILKNACDLRRAETSTMPNLHWRGSWPQIRRGYEQLLRKEGLWR